MKDEDDATDRGDNWWDLISLFSVYVRMDEYIKISVWDHKKPISSYNLMSEGQSKVAWKMSGETWDRTAVQSVKLMTIV